MHCFYVLITLQLIRFQLDVFFSIISFLLKLPNGSQQLARKRAMLIKENRNVNI